MAKSLAFGRELVPTRRQAGFAIASLGVGYLVAAMATAFFGSQPGPTPGVGLLILGAMVCFLLVRGVLRGERSSTRLASAAFVATAGIWTVLHGGGLTVVLAFYAFALRNASRA